MPLTTQQLGGVVADLLSQYRIEQRRCRRIARFMDGCTDGIYVPREASAEYKLLVDQSQFNIMPIVVGSLAQNLFVDGYRPTNPESGRAPSEANVPLWDAAWQPNRMDARQAAIWRTAAEFGYSYTTVLPGKLKNQSTPVITPYSPRKLTAIYEDQVNDEWPVYAMTVKSPLFTEAQVWQDPLANPSTAEGVKITVYDEQFRYHLVRDRSGWSVIGDAEEHGLGVVPIVRFLDSFADDELPAGKVEPLIPTQKQLNQTTFGLNMAQQYAAFRQRWILNMPIQEDEQGNPTAPFNSAVNRVWQINGTENGPEPKAGEFSETNLSGYLDSRDKLLLYVASFSQIPVQQLVVGAGISNISAEALVALQDSHRHDIAEHQTSFGEGTEQMMRLSALAMGDTAGWEDMSARVHWRDTTPRSIGQVADALGKYAQMLGVPPRALWRLIPGVTDQDLAEWEAMAEEQDMFSDLSSMLEDGETGAEPGSTPADAAA